LNIEGCIETPYGCCRSEESVIPGAWGEFAKIDRRRGVVEQPIFRGAASCL